MEYPNIPITQDMWNTMFTKSVTEHLRPKQKYVDIAKPKKRKTKRKSSKTNKEQKSAPVIKTKSKPLNRLKTNKKSTPNKMQRVLKAPVNFMT